MNRVDLSGPKSLSPGAEDALVDAVRAAVEAVGDPELAGVSIGDLGLVVSVAVDEAGRAEVHLMPTFLGCPATALIANDVRNAAGAAGATSVGIRYVHVPLWHPSRISDRGRRALAELGIAVPTPDQPTLCPFCHGDAMVPAAPVGPTACRSVAWCPACRNVVEVMRAEDYEPAAMPVAFLTPRRRESYAHV